MVMVTHTSTTTKASVKEVTDFASETKGYSIPVHKSAGDSAIGVSKSAEATNRLMFRHELK